MPDWSSPNHLLQAGGQERDLQITEIASFVFSPCDNFLLT